MHLENIMLNEISPTQKVTYCVIILTDMSRIGKFIKTKRLAVFREGREGMETGSFWVWSFVLNIKIICWDYWWLLHNIVNVWIPWICMLYRGEFYDMWVISQTKKLPKTNNNWVWLHCLIWKSWSKVCNCLLYTSDAADDPRVV